MKAWCLIVLGVALAGAPRQGVKTIAVSSVLLPKSFGGAPDVRASLDSLIAERLRAEGFGVVPPQAAESIQLRLRDSIGGYYDTYTGKRVESKYEAVQGGTRRELKARYGADAWLHTVVGVVGASFTGGKVKWHGVEEKSGARGGLGGFMFGTKTGTVPALSLFVVLEDTEGKSVYAGVGGIELASRIEGDHFVDIPRADLLRDGARNAAAVHLALDSLPARLAAPPGP
jgi:hypothetical protein